MGIVPSKKMGIVGVKKWASLLSPTLCPHLYSLITINHDAKRRGRFVCWCDKKESN